VHRREVAMQHLAAVELAEDFEDARDLAPHERLGPACGVAFEKRAEIAVARVLERKAVEHAFAGAHQRKGVEHANRARVIVEELPEVRFTQPAVHPWARLDADRLGNGRRASDAPREIHLSESSLAE